MYRPVKIGARGRFESLTPDIDRKVTERMDRQTARMSEIAKREELIALLHTKNLRDRRANELDRDECQRLEREKADFNEAVRKRKVIPVDFTPRQQQNKPPKRAA